MELIDRYVGEVSRYLPRKGRADILTELRSSLEDALDDRVEGEPTEDDVVALLKEFGHPKQIAVSYRPSHQYLIGPELYPFFELVTGIVLIVLAAVAVFNGVMGFFPPSTQAVGLGEWLIVVLGTVVQGAMIAFCSIVIVFAILQRLEVKLAEPETDWNPRDLPTIEDVDRVGRGESIAGVTFSVIALILLNVFHDRIGIVMTLGEEPLLTNVVQDNLLWLNISLVLGLVLNALLLWQARWHWYTRFAKFATDLFFVYVIYRLAAAISMEQSTLVKAGFAEPLPSLFVKLGYLVVVGVAISVLIDAAMVAYRLLRRKHPRSVFILELDQKRSEAANRR